MADPEIDAELSLRMTSAEDREQLTISNHSRVRRPLVVRYTLLIIGGRRDGQSIC